ncbi:3-oxoadipate enol-lactonase [Yoonia sediminilitoris]|uniref:3-oxoadipate enol-lactonase n=1 Tax=Yoonia sediminilitoris TaxID=1286148 RepID=A0A2T6KBB5_9RHOB|nr:3-oxoadipate enol-lactonase [Yoonia sediminilitoris]PUB12138.1 3-oxoadipate enol-lactonase [Yoonia sediminilitoris]RCW92965.1 3-oxoadipate enol-lactonase [Yoonia sediminilitoris]
MKIDRDGVNLQVEVSGPEDGPAIVFSNSLGTTLHLWDQVIPLLPEGLRLVRYDMRGHGQSDVPDPPYTMGQLVSDAEAVCDALNVRDCLFVGLSVGGMIAQGLAVKRPDIIRAMVLSNTADKIGNKALWEDRINAVTQQGLAAIADGVMQRWFGSDFYGTPAMAQWQQMLSDTPAAGYAGVCAAIAGTDFYTPTSGLRIPTLGIAGSQDKSTPPDLVRETVDLIPGSQFALMQRAGHLPCVENPTAFAELLNKFIADTGHL